MNKLKAVLYKTNTCPTCVFYRYHGDLPLCDHIFRVPVKNEYELLDWCEKNWILKVKEDE